MGAVVAMLPPPEEDEDEAHAATTTSPMASERRRRGTAVRFGRRVVDAEAMCDSSRETRGLRQRSEHLGHPLDLDGLIGVHVGGKLEEEIILGGPGRTEELLDHGERALMMLDHVLEE